MRSSASSAAVFAALGDETRLRLVSRLCDGGPTSITNLTRGTPITRQAITKHLRVMQDAGLVRNTKQGRESYWELDRRRLEEARRNLALISKQWDDALDRLRQFVETDQAVGPGALNAKAKNAATPRSANATR
jgi:DNA-binding transcriptional ArsR family regulator